jgi:hypothetical protein
VCGAGWEICELRGDFDFDFGFGKGWRERGCCQFRSPLRETIWDREVFYKTSPCGPNRWSFE